MNELRKIFENQHVVTNEWEFTHPKNLIYGLKEFSSNPWRDKKENEDLLLSTKIYDCLNEDGIIPDCIYYDLELEGFELKTIYQESLFYKKTREKCEKLNIFKHVAVEMYCEYEDGFLYACFIVKKHVKPLYYNRLNSIPQIIDWTAVNIPTAIKPIRESGRNWVELKLPNYYFIAIKVFTGTPQSIKEIYEDCKRVTPEFYEIVDYAKRYDYVLEDNSIYFVLELDIEKLIKINMKENIYTLPVYWQMEGSVSIKEESLEEAILYFLKNKDKFQMNKDGKYVNGSFQIKEESIYNDTENVHCMAKILREIYGLH